MGYDRVAIGFPRRPDALRQAKPRLGIRRGGQDDNPLPTDLNRKWPEVKLPPEPWLPRTLRIGVVSIIGLWIVAGVVIFIAR